MNVPYDYYRIFYYVAQYRSLTKAAAVLGNSQPNLSRCMNQLEHSLGCTLLVRSHQGVTLTPEGERLYAHVAVACRQLLLGEEEVAKAGGLEQGQVSLGVSETALHLFLLERLEKFHRDYPGIRLRISNHSTPQAIAALQAGLVDFAVVTTPTELPGSLREIQLHPFREILIASRQTVIETPLTLEELGEYPLVCLGEGTGTRAFYRQFFADHGLPLRVEVEAATTDQVLPLVRYGLGLGFFPREMAQSAIDRGEIRALPITEIIPRRWVCLIRDPARPFSMAARCLEKALLPPEE